MKRSTHGRNRLILRQSGKGNLKFTRDGLATPRRRAKTLLKGDGTVVRFSLKAKTANAARFQFSNSLSAIPVLFIRQYQIISDNFVPEKSPPADIHLPSTFFSLLISS